MKILNLYGGIGGNRKLWDNCEIVTVEYNEKIAMVYKKLYPKDIVVIGDAHIYLLDHYQEFDFIWSSPPCQKNSKMVKFTRHKNKSYPDLRLYEEI
jgi:DNA (cytosine-5)-methyltransferase 1